MSGRAEGGWSADPSETPELVAEEMRACLKDRAEAGLPLTIKTRELSTA